MKDEITTEKETPIGRIIFYFNSIYIGYAYKEVDGFYVFIFAVHYDGAWTEYGLRMVADKLQELNKPYADQVNEYFKNQ